MDVYKVDGTWHLASPGSRFWSQWHAVACSGMQWHAVACSGMQLQRHTATSKCHATFISHFPRCCVVFSCCWFLSFLFCCCSVCCVRTPARIHLFDFARLIYFACVVGEVSLVCLQAVVACISFFFSFSFNVLRMFGGVALTLGALGIRYGRSKAPTRLAALAAHAAKRSKSETASKSNANGFRIALCQLMVSNDKVCLSNIQLNTLPKRGTQNSIQLLSLIVLLGSLWILQICTSLPGCEPGKRE